MNYGVVVGTQRTGTTVLRSVLSTHPKLKTFGEVFLNRHSNMKESYYKYLQMRLTNDVKLCVPSAENFGDLFKGYLEYLQDLSNEADCITFDCKYNFLQGALIPGEMGMQKRPFLLHLFRENEVKIIHLIRKDVLATYVSSLLSVKNQVWATSDLSRLKARSVEVPLENLVENLRSRVAEQEYFKALLPAKMVKTIFYEDMIIDGVFSEDVMDVVAEHLGVENQFQLEPELKKIAPSLQESIINFTQVKDLLKDTEFTLGN
ncbi:MAG: sulfotransferase [Bacteroidota bacterium]